MNLEDKAIRFLQDAQFVEPGNVINLDYYQGIKTYIAGYQAACGEDKYKILKELINEWIARETEDLKECKAHGGYNTPGAGMAMGALEAYRQVLSDIKELEQEVGFND